MICEEKGLFLEIAEIIRSLGLTILKGIMESHEDKVWAKFFVEASAFVSVDCFFCMDIDLHTILRKKDLNSLLHFLCFPRTKSKRNVYNFCLTFYNFWYFALWFHMHEAGTRLISKENNMAKTRSCFLTLCSTILMQADRDVQRVDVLLPLVQKLPLPNKSNISSMSIASQAPKWSSLRFSKSIHKIFIIESVAVTFITDYSI